MTWYGPDGGPMTLEGWDQPIHRALQYFVESTPEHEPYDRVLVVVAAMPPHKTNVADRTAFHHRVAMTRLGVEGLGRLEVLELEGRRKGPSYTVDTLEKLAG